MICLFCTYEDLIYGDTNPSNQVLCWVLCKENFSSGRVEGDAQRSRGTTTQAWGCQATTLQPSWYQVSKPNYMAIKKALYGRQPGCFYFWFSLCPLAITRDLVFSFVSEIFNKVPSFTYFGLKKLLFLFGDFIPARICARYDF